MDEHEHAERERDPQEVGQRVENGLHQVRGTAGPSDSVGSAGLRGRAAGVPVNGEQVVERAPTHDSQTEEPEDPLEGPFQPPIHENVLSPGHAPSAVMPMRNDRAVKKIRLENDDSKVCRDPRSDEGRRGGLPGRLIQITGRTKCVGVPHGVDWADRASCLGRPSPEEHRPDCENPLFETQTAYGPTKGRT